MSIVNFGKTPDESPESERASEDNDNENGGGDESSSLSRKAPKRKPIERQEQELKHRQFKITADDNKERHLSVAYSAYFIGNRVSIRCKPLQTNEIAFRTDSLRFSLNKENQLSVSYTPRQKDTHTVVINNPVGFYNFMEELCVEEKDTAKLKTITTLMSRNPVSIVTSPDHAPRVTHRKPEVYVSEGNKQLKLNFSIVRVGCTLSLTLKNDNDKKNRITISKCRFTREENCIKIECLKKNGSIDNTYTLEPAYYSYLHKDLGKYKGVKLSEACTLKYNELCELLAVPLEEPSLIKSYIASTHIEPETQQVDLLGGPDKYVPSSTNHVSLGSVVDPLPNGYENYQPIDNDFLEGFDDAFFTYVNAPRPVQPLPKKLADNLCYARAAMYFMLPMLEGVQLNGESDLKSIFNYLSFKQNDKEKALEHLNNLVANTFQNQDPSAQQDFSEFLIRNMNRLEENSPGSLVSLWISEKSVLRDPNGQTRENPVEQKWLLNLSIPDDGTEPSVRDLLESYLTWGQLLTATTDGFTHKQQVISTAGDKLILGINRFLNDGSKNATPIEPIFDLEIFDKSYHMKSFVIHEGNSQKAGHYTTYCHNGRGDWFYLNDDSCIPMLSGVEDAAKQAYYYLYEAEPMEQPEAPEENRMIDEVDEKQEQLLGNRKMHEDIEPVAPIENRLRTRNRPLRTLSPLEQSLNAQMPNIESLFAKNFSASKKVKNAIITRDFLIDRETYPNYEQTQSSLLDSMAKTHFENTVFAPVEKKYINAIRGFGLFAAENILENSIIGIYKGSIIFPKPNTSYTHAWQYPATHRLEKGEWPLMIDGKGDLGNDLQYVNSCSDEESFNLEVRDIQLGRLVFLGYVATRDVAKGEQLFISYGRDYWKNLPYIPLSASELRPDTL